MDESLAAISRALSDDNLDLASMMCEAVTLIRLYLDRPGMNSRSRLSGIRHVVDELCPPVQPAACTAPLAPVLATAADVAGELIRILTGNPAPFTLLLERLAREATWVRVVSEVTRPATDGERRRLHIRPGTSVYVRTGQLVTVSGGTAADVRITVVPELLPDEVRGGLSGSVPFGMLAAPYGLARRARVAAAGGGDLAVISTALLEVEGELAGFSAEAVPLSFCEHAAALAAGDRAGFSRSAVSA